MPAYSIELPMDHHLWKRNSNNCHYMFEMDIQLWFLDKSDRSSRRDSYYLKTNKY